MPDLASSASGADVFLATSHDPDCAGGRAIDGKAGTCWLTTGLYPQELILRLAQPGVISRVRVLSSRMRRFRLEGCYEESPINFRFIGEGELEDTEQNLQVLKLSVTATERPIEFLRIIIFSGWHDFCSIHQIQADGTAVPRPSKAPTTPRTQQDEYDHLPLDDGPLQERRPERSGSQRCVSPSSSQNLSRRLKRQGTRPLEVSIPQVSLKKQDEPDAPREPDKTCPWEEADGVRSAMSIPGGLNRIGN